MDNDDFKSLVIKMAREIFIKYGYKKTTMNDIARACHKSKGLIYHHYKSKEEIFKIVINNELNQMIYDIETVIEGDGDLIEKMKSFLTKKNDFFNSRTHVFHLIISELFDYLHFIEDIVKKLDTKLLGITKKILVEGLEKGVIEVDDIDRTALSIHQMNLGYNNPLTSSILFNNDFDLDNFIDIILNGIIKR